MVQPVEIGLAYRLNSGKGVLGIRALVDEDQAMGCPRLCRFISDRLLALCEFGFSDGGLNWALFSLPAIEGVPVIALEAGSTARPTGSPWR